MACSTFCAAMIGAIYSAVIEPTKAFIMSYDTTSSPPHARTIHSLIPPRLLVNKRSSIKRHSLHVRLGRHRLARIAHLAQQLEIVDVKRWCRSEEQLRLLVRRVGEGVRRPYRHRHVVAGVRVDDFLVFARVRRVRDVEADGALRDVEGLVVHFVPVGWRAGRFGGERELDGSEAVVCGWFLVKSVLIERVDDFFFRVWLTMCVPVREPSSRIRHVIWPRWIVSPAFAGTKLSGRSGILMKPSKPMPAEVMISRSEFSCFRCRRL
jgi:hypothetical protein